MQAFASSDIDLFLVGLSEQQAVQRIVALRGHLGNTVKAIVRTKTTITFARGARHRNVQVILRLYRSVAEGTSGSTLNGALTLLAVLTGFDLDCCCVATADGARVSALLRAHRALTRLYNLAGADASR